MKPDFVTHGIRFHWDEDAEEYTAQVTPVDLAEIYEDGYDQGRAEAEADESY